MISAGFPLMILLFLQGILTAPPQDFASLLKPAEVLQQLQVQTNETSLLAVLTTSEATGRTSVAQLEQAVKDLGGRAPERKHGQQVLRAAGEDAIPLLEKAATSPDPEVKITAQQILAEVRQQRVQAAQNNTGYLKQLMAIRALQECKSTKAIPLLHRLAIGGNPTLSDAATNAILIIRGMEMQRTKGDTLRAVMTHLPANTGFVATCDLERNRQARTVDDFLNKLRKDAEKDPQLQPMTGQFGSMTGEIQKNLIQGLGLVGNVRLDSITVLISPDLGVSHDVGYVAVVVKGLHDPAMVAAAIKQANRQIMEKTYKKQTVFFERDVAFASLDKHTFVVAFGDANDGSQIHEVLDALLAEPKLEAPKALQPAFELVLAGKARLAMAGSFGETQKQSILQDINRELQQMQQRGGNGQGLAWETAFLEMIKEQFKVKTYVGKVTDEFGVTIDGTCADAVAAAGIADKINKLDQRIRELLTNQMAQMAQMAPMQVQRPAFPKIDLKKPLFEATVADGKVSVSLISFQEAMTSIMPMWMMMMFSGAF